MAKITKKSPVKGLAKRKVGAARSVAKKIVAKKVASAAVVKAQIAVDKLHLSIKKQVSAVSAAQKKAIAAKKKAAKSKTAASKKAAMSALNTVKKASAASAILRDKVKNAALALNTAKALDLVKQAEANEKARITTMVDRLELISAADFKKAAVDFEKKWKKTRAASNAKKIKAAEKKAEAKIKGVAKKAAAKVKAAEKKATAKPKKRKVKKSKSLVKKVIEVKTKKKPVVKKR